ncbi:MAG: hypothetical protein FH762_18345 [Firmicutes bacterium]|nr:hypothetical protein [Bacillota bacterium]
MRYNRSFKEITSEVNIVVDIPLGLRQVLESGECTLFVGAGIGHYLRDSNNNKIPDGKNLALDLAEEFNIQTGGNNDLAKVSQIVEIRKGRTELETYIKSRLSNITPDECLQWLTSIKWRAIYTTNYDSGIEVVYSCSSNPKQECFPITASSEIKQYDPRFEVPLYYLHGSISSVNPNIIITADDYVKYNERRRMMFEQLKLDLATSTILYIGYSNNDPNWNTVLNEISREYYPNKIPNSYRIDPYTDELEEEILHSKNVETIKCNFEEFANEATEVLKELKLDYNLDSIKKAVPADLHDIFDNNPAAVTRLLASWSYVSSVPFNGTPNIYNFLRGDKPNWSLVAKNEHFERDIEDEIYEYLLDYATINTNKPAVDIILGPAGYETTTILMTLATRLVKDGAGSVFFLKIGREIKEGDIEFAISISEEKTFFFVDNAAEYAHIINSIRHKYREQGKAAMFVLGERTNEWNQMGTRLNGRIFPIEPLSDAEINRLLDCLEKHRELNRLENLEKELQIAAIKKNYNRELLVAIREATEGESFDAIIEDEFRGIADDFSKELYLAVCCFHQHGALVRDSLLAKLMDINLIKMYDKSKAPTSGLIVYECIDKYKGLYVARARHRTIASIVWERCGMNGNKDFIIQKALNFLNLNYKVDKDAFEYFIRSDRFVDSLKNFESKVKFFETACNKDPDSPYVRQHYARMLLRENNTNLALDQINDAIDLNENARVLHHTKGQILASMAFNIESEDVARKRLLQSEKCYRRALSMYKKDEYSYQGLAQLYLGWAKRASSEDEEIEYINKSEEIINEGLKVVKNRDSLWIESSNVQKYLGNQPTSIKHLEKAVSDSPNSIIARYLIGRAYNHHSYYEKTLEILKPIIKNHPNEYRCHIEYAIALMYLGRPYKDSIAILSQSTLYGYSDSRFIATYGGLLLLDKQFTEAEKVFTESLKRELPDLYTIYFRPKDPENKNKPLRIEGKVKRVRAGYSIIDAPNYPEFLCPASKFGNLVMEEDMKINFEIAFRSKGAIADNPSVA